MKSPRSHLVIFCVLGSLLIISFGAFFRLWAENKEISVRPVLPPVIFQQANTKGGFINSTVKSSSDDFLEAKNKLVVDKEDFIAIDLSEMKLTLYAKGLEFKTFNVLSKGRDGSWWETPTGIYSVLSKESNHFSSIGRVWMPWSIQFYGNFFIHGWPYYAGGELVPQSYSGGCVRLSTEDAKEVFGFVKRDTPIVLYDIDSELSFRPVLQSKDDSIKIPEFSAKAVLAADLDSGDVFLNKNGDEALPIASLAKLMTATVASELIYLDRTILIKPEMLKDAIQSYEFEPGNRYKAFDLLYPLLMESSNGAARALAAFLGDSYFVKQMNEKAKTIGMNDTVFADSSGVSDDNISSLKDLAKLAKYILEKRQFVFGITRGKGFDNFGEGNLARISNYNEFYTEENLIGLKNGKTTGAKETLLGVWRFKDDEGFSRNIMIGVLGSENRLNDVQAARGWLQKSYGLK